MATKPLFLVLALSALPSLASAASEGMGRVDQASLMILAGPVLTTFATMGTTSHPIEMLESAKGMPWRSSARTGIFVAHGLNSP